MYGVYGARVGLRLLGGARRLRRVSIGPSGRVVCVCASFDSLSQQKRYRIEYRDQTFKNLERESIVLSSDAGISTGWPIKKTLK